MVTIEAVAENTVYRNDDNGYTVLLVKAGRSRISAVGNMPVIAEGERLRISGDWIEHPVYGKQIKVSAIEIMAPETTDAVEKYLASGLIRGVGASTAQRIVKTFGKQALEIMAQGPERLTEVPGIGEKKAEMIYESFQEQYRQREALLFLQKYDVSPSLAMKIFKQYGDDMQEILRHNPYRVVDDIKGIGFKTADRIASSMGIEKNSEYRLNAGIRYVLNTASNNSGHCYMPRPLLVEECRKILESDSEPVEHALDGLIVTQQVKAEILPEEDGKETVAVYGLRAWKSESDVAVRLSRMAAVKEPADELREEEIRQIIGEVERTEGLRLHPAQKQAIQMAVTSHVSVITGGPGTGKTTIIKCILKLLGEGEEIALAAPTGRAAKRMTEACGMEAKTIHRLLEYGGEEGVFQRDSDNPLTFDTVIIDEMSMVDIFLMRSLLFALPFETRLILVGDADQLPSVGAGNVLRDILNSKSIPSVALSEIFRQDEKSMIVYNAHAINNGNMPKLNTKGGDFFFERAYSASEATDKIITLSSIRLPSYLGIEDPVRQIQILAPMKKGECGVWELNRKLQACFNPPQAGKKEKLFGDVLFREGDKVMQMRNDYNLRWRKEGIFGWEEGQGVFNGDIGYIESIDPEEGYITVCFDDEREAEYDETNLDDLELAYCISIHKSQGSEFPVVIIPAVGGSPMLLNRNLLYTAVTRARKLVMIVGREQVVQQMVANAYMRKRYTALAWRLARYSAYTPVQPEDAF